MNTSASSLNDKLMSDHTRCFCSYLSEKYLFFAKKLNTSAGAYSKDKSDFWHQIFKRRRLSTEKDLNWSARGASIWGRLCSENSGTVYNGGLLSRHFEVRWIWIRTTIVCFLRFLGILGLRSCKLWVYQKVCDQNGGSYSIVMHEALGAIHLLRHMNFAIFRPPSLPVIQASSKSALKNIL